MEEAYANLHAAYVQLAQVHELWATDVDAYLREESYLEAEAEPFLNGIVEILRATNDPLRQLSDDHKSLCNDLRRVDRGESFSV